jgi:hypothetical protein
LTGRERFWVFRTFATLPKFLVVHDDDDDDDDNAAAADDDDNSNNNKTELPPLMILGLCVSTYVIKMHLNLLYIS